MNFEVRDNDGLHDEQRREAEHPFRIGSAGGSRQLIQALRTHNDPAERLARGVEQLVEITNANATAIRTLADAVAKLVLLVEREADARPHGRR